MAADEEHEGASIKELLIEACRRNNTDLLLEVLHDKPDAEITALLNNTTTVMGNHLYHEAASHGNYEIIDLLLDQPSFECDHPSTASRATRPLHTAIRWLNAEPPRPAGLWQGPRRDDARGGLEPARQEQGRPDGPAARRPAQRRAAPAHTASTSIRTRTAGDFITVDASAAHSRGNSNDRVAAVGQQSDGDDDDDAEFSGSDEEERGRVGAEEKGKAEMILSRAA
ncbi:hypothetical protein J3459_021563 [Metarhizium acridum]|nr:hypothetical protein J3459_021563 [Metarhizium acridum]